MWEQGTLQIENQTVKYWCKVLDQKSATFGIDGGRIIKMELRIDKACTLNYDRGWDIEPEDEASQLAYMALLKKYN